MNPMTIPEGNLCNALSNAEFARLNGSKPESVIWRLSRYGHYYGVRPWKLPNGRLMWNRDDAIELLRKNGAPLVNK